jgi:MFS family permease
VEKRSRTPIRFGPVEASNGAAAGSTSGFSAFRHRDFRLFWVGAVLSNTGTWMQLVTVPFVLDQLTHSTAWVGFAAFCAFFPTTLVAPWAGSLADRYSRRSLLLWAQSVSMASAIGLWLLWISHSATAVGIIVLVLVGAVANGFTISAWQAFVPQLVPPDDMISAVRLNSMTFTGARAIGPALAGLVLATLGAGAAFLANAISFAIVIGALLLIPPRPVGDAGGHGSVLAHFRDGFRYLRARQMIVLATLSAAASAFFGVAVVQLAEPIARRLFHAGAGKYGLMVAAYGLGAVVGSFFAVTRGDSIRRSTMTMIGLSAFVVGLVVLGVLPALEAAIVLFSVLGIAQVFCNVSAQTAVQVNVDEQYRARVMSIYAIGFFAGTPIGALVAGVTAQLIGLRETIVLYGLLFGVSVALLAVRYRWFRPLDESLPAIHDPHAAAPGFRPLATDLDTSAHLVVEPLD